MLEFFFFFCLVKLLFMLSWQHIDKCFWNPVNNFQWLLSLTDYCLACYSVSKTKIHILNSLSTCAELLASCPFSSWMKLLVMRITNTYLLLVIVTCSKYRQFVFILFNLYSTSLVLLRMGISLLRETWPRQQRYSHIVTVGNNYKTFTNTAQPQSNLCL